MKKSSIIGQNDIFMQGKLLLLSQHGAVALVI